MTTNTLGRQWPDAPADPRSPEYAAWHQQRWAHVRQEARSAQVSAARAHLTRASELRSAGDRPAAARALTRAAAERNIASRMPR